MENLTANAEKGKQPEESSSEAVDTPVKNQDLASKRQRVEATSYESRFIDHISKEALCDGPLHVGENLVGVHARVNKLNLMRFRGSSKVNMIGICGISGIGKTTLAKAIYNSMYTYFEGSCFCEDVAKRQDLTQVQTQLINKILKSEDVKIHGKSEGVEKIKQRVGREPILVALDDVDHREQLEALAGSHDWFCPGSMIILTGKDKQLLPSHGADEIYEMEFLGAHEDIKLFCLYAFRQTYPTNDFKHLAYKAVKFLQGHPLALKVVGSALFGSCERIWRSEFDRLQTYPNSEIQQKLRPSFELLDFDQKRIFLDTASFLIGENLDFGASVVSIDCSVDANINVLVNKSLITISPYGSSLQMHELIRSMAREVLREEPYWPIRLCGPSQVYAVLGENNVTQTTKAVEVLVLLLEKSTKTVQIDCEAFSKMEKLRILKICHPEPKDFEESFQSPVNFLGRLVFLSNELRLMYWHGYPFKSLPSDFYPENVVAIDMSYSNIESFWTTPKCFERLKVMKLRHCRNLTTTPDFTKMTNLENLILEGCVNLVKLHPSIGILKKLVMLNMRDCTNIRSIPRKVELDSLQVLILPGCFKTDIPSQVLSTLKSLVKPNADETAMTGFPSFISSLTNLQVLEINGQQAESPTWRKSIFQKQPQSFGLPSLASLRLLTKLKLDNCNISEVCDDIGDLSCLRKLYLSHNNFTKLPESLGKLSRLEKLSLTCCKKLEVCTKFPPHLGELDVSQCTSLQELPRQIPRRSYFAYYCTNCPKIMGNVTIDSQVSMSQTYRFIEFLGIESRVREFFSGGGGFSGTDRRLDMVIEGNNRIPEWYTNRSKGNHVKVELPPHWCYSMFKGYALCAVFTVVMDQDVMWKTLMEPLYRALVDGDSDTTDTVIRLR